MESLVDRFCLKLKFNENDERSLTLTGYCLTLCHYNYKALKILMDNFHTYKEALHNQSVYQSMKNILKQANSTKDAKNEVKVS